MEALGEQGTSAVQEGDGQHAADGGDEHVARHLNHAPGRGDGSTRRSALFDTEVPCGDGGIRGRVSRREGLAR